MNDFSIGMMMKSNRNKKENLICLLKKWILVNGHVPSVKQLNSELGTHRNKLKKPPKKS